VELPVIGEVILINNRVDATPDHPIFNHWKIKHHKMSSNIYVNPAWNLGVALAKYNTVCILSDDILVDLRVFFEADKFVSKEIGLLCMGTSWEIYQLHYGKHDEISDVSKLIISGDLKINWEGDATGVCGSGTLFFIHKNNWIPIPEEFKVNFGDTWQRVVQSKMNRKNYFINDCFYHTPYSVSINSGVASEYMCSEQYARFESMEHFNSCIEAFKSEI
jgi:hypothetical protein